MKVRGRKVDVSRGSDFVASVNVEVLRTRYLISAALLALAGQALAQTSTTTTTSSGDSFYVVQEPSTKKCTITTSKPAGTTTTVVGGDGTVYKTRTEAEAAMKKVTTCTQ